MNRLQNPAYLESGDPRFRRSAETSPGAALDKAISQVAIGLGCLGLVSSVSIALGGSESAALFFGALSLGYLLGGLLNSYLSALWSREDMSWRVQLLVMVLKPPLVIFLGVAIIVAFLLWLLFEYTRWY